MKYVIWTALFVGLSVRASAQPAALPLLLPEAYEVALARSAAPRQLSDHTDVYVLRRGGHEQVRTGTNGTACLVLRDHPDSLYPICYDREATRTVLFHDLDTQRLREAGFPEDSIDARIERAYAQQNLPLPTRAAVTYMMSRHQVIYTGADGSRVGRWHPHLMIYLPGLVPDDLGMTGIPDGDLMVSDAGSPSAHFVVMTKDWAEAPPLPPAEGRLVAEPGWLCPGDTFTLRYEGPGDPARQFVHAPEAVRPDTLVFVEGYQLVASGPTGLVALGPDNSVLASDSLSFHPNHHLEHHFVRSAECSGRLSVASMAIPPSSASDNIRPQSVANQGDESLTVTHRGIAVRLAPGEETRAFNAGPFSGDWGVIVDTGAYNAACPSQAGGTEPPEVELIIITACGQAP